MIKDYIKLCRCSHYIKNGLVFLPLVFIHGIFTNQFVPVLYGFIAFSFMSSVVYIINDIRDIEKDRLHPVKCHRPLAAGRIKIKKAYFLAIGLFMLSVCFNYLAAGLNLYVLILLLMYALANLSYSLGLKDIALIDILILVFGYLIRVYYGASIIGVDVSNWLYLTIMSAAFFFAFGKRRNEMLKVNKNSRNVLNAYNREFLDKNMYLCLALTIVFYSLWAIIQDIQYLVITVPIVMVIFMKYTLVVEGDSHGDPIDVLLKDRFLQLLLFIFCIFIVYLMR